MAFYKQATSKLVRCKCAWWQARPAQVRVAASKRQQVRVQVAASELGGAGGASGDSPGEHADDRRELPAGGGHRRRRLPYTTTSIRYTTTCIRYTTTCIRYTTTFIRYTTACVTFATKWREARREDGKNLVDVVALVGLEGDKPLLHADQASVLCLAHGDPLGEGLKVAADAADLRQRQCVSG